MIELSDHAEGCILAIRAQPNAKRSGLQGERNGALKVAVSAPPEDGRANEAIVELLRDKLNLKRWQIEILSGHTSRDKRLLLRATKEEIRERLDSRIGPV